MRCYLRKSKNTHGRNAALISLFAWAKNKVVTNKVTATLASANSELTSPVFAVPGSSVPAVDSRYKLSRFWRQIPM